MRRNMIEDKLLEFKPRMKGVIYGVKNGSVKAYVFDLGHAPESWEGYRYSIQLIIGNEVSSHRPTGSNNLEEAKTNARQTVSGRAYRHFLRQMR